MYIYIHIYIYLCPKPATLRALCRRQPPSKTTRMRVKASNAKHTGGSCGSVLTFRFLFYNLVSISVEK